MISLKSMKSFKFELAEMLHLEDIQLREVKEGDEATFVIIVNKISPHVPVKKRLFHEGGEYKFYSETGEEKEAWVNVVKDNIEHEKKFHQLSDRVLQFSKKSNNTLSQNQNTT